MNQNTNVIMRKFLSVFMTIIFGLTYNTFCQDEGATESVVISGTVDTYFRANLNTTNDLESGGSVAPETSFANRPGFSLGMANIIASFESDAVGFVGDLVFGPRGTDAVFESDPSFGSSHIVNQLYAYWNVSDKVTLTMGNFNTFLGYEVISPGANFNYSTSYMFSYGPFSHTGLKADFALGGGFSLMTGILNPTDVTEFNPSGEYLAGTQVGYETESGSIYLNALFDDDFYQFDITTGWDLSDNFYAGVNTTYAKDAFYGFATYLQLSTSETFAIGLRGEYFSDEGIAVVGDGDSVLDLTLSANYKVGNLTIIPELRMDAASTEVFMDSELATQKSLSSFVLAAVYSF